MSHEASQSVIRAAMSDMVNAVTALRQLGNGPMAEALKNLAERIAGCALPTSDRQEIIENLVFVGQQAQLQPEKRKRGVVRAALVYVKDAMQRSEPLHDAWHTFGHTVENFFHLQA
jgi:hypothetical protein